MWNNPCMVIIFWLTNINWTLLYTTDNTILCSEGCGTSFQVQQREQSMVGVGGVSPDVMSPSQATFFAMSWMGGSEVPMILCAVLTTPRRTAGSWPDRDAAGQCALYSASVKGSENWRGEMCSLHRKCMRCWALFTRAPVWWDQVRVSVICTPRTLVLLTLYTAVSLMRSGVWLGWLLLKSTMISLVLSMVMLFFTSSLCRCHHR